MKEHTIGITTEIDKAKIYTFIDFTNKQLIIKREGVIVFEGTSDEFKARLNSIEAEFDKAIYADILDVAEEIINLMSSK